MFVWGVPFSGPGLPPNRQPGPSADHLRNHPHVSCRDRDASFGRRDTWPGQVEKNRTAAPLDARLQIVVDDDDEIVGCVGSIQLLMASVERQSHQLVVTPVCLVVAPAIGL